MAESISGLTFKLCVVKFLEGCITAGRMLVSKPTVFCVAAIAVVLLAAKLLKKR